MSRFEDIEQELRKRPRKWLITGVAGFIGSNLLEYLLRNGQRVVGLDNFATGHRENLDEVARALNGTGGQFELIEGDIRDLETCHRACAGVDVVLHQAALGSVPRSLADPIATHQTNLDGFLNMLVAARDAGAKRFVYASSSSVYGDHPALPKVEPVVGEPLSPYAVTKRANEQYARVFHQNYGLETIGLRYFNVFGPRQDPHGPYAAVIPAWVGKLLDGEPCRINGDGESSRDFCYIGNVVQANVLAAHVRGPGMGGEVYNVAYGGRTTLNQLFEMIRDGLVRHRPELASAKPVYGEFRPGDIRHSHADIGKITDRLGYEPRHSAEDGLALALAWYLNYFEARASSGITKFARPIPADHGRRVSSARAL